VIVAYLLACVSFAACGSGSGQDGVTSVKPTNAQLDAMSSYFLVHYGSGYGWTSHTGCSTYSMGTHPESGGRMIAYTQVVCGSCPATTGPAETTPIEEAEIPAVFHLRGASVTSAQADTEPGNPMFGNVINQNFPESLRTAAAEQQIPNVNALIQKADARGGC
jgi:predicted metal-binding protein